MAKSACLGLGFTDFLGLPGSKGQKTPVLDHRLADKEYTSYVIQNLHKTPLLKLLRYNSIGWVGCQAARGQQQATPLITMTHDHMLLASQPLFFACLLNTVPDTILNK